MRLSRQTTETRRLEMVSQRLDGLDARADAMAERVAELEDRAARLEYREGQIIALLRNPREWKHWPSFILDNDLTAKQVKGICDVLEQTYQSLSRGEAIEAREFEKQLLPHIPEKEKPSGTCAYDFVKGILMTISETGQWPGLPGHFRQAFNVPTIREKLTG
jgi:hypothetical protein